MRRWSKLASGVGGGGGVGLAGCPAPDAPRCAAAEQPRIRTTAIQARGVTGRQVRGSLALLQDCLAASALVRMISQPNEYIPVLNCRQRNTNSPERKTGRRVSACLPEEGGSSIYKFQAKLQTSRALRTCDLAEDWATWIKRAVRRTTGERPDRMIESV